MATIEVVIGKYRDIRDRLDTERKIFKAFEKKAKEDMMKLSMWLSEKANEQGVTSFATPAGTAYRAKKEQVRVQDWDIYLEWMVKNNNLHCVEKRCAKLNLLEVMVQMGLGKPVEEGQNEPPFAPADIGIHYQLEYEYQVRKPSGG